MVILMKLIENRRRGYAGFLGRLRDRSCLTSALDEKNWTIAGSGSIGEKAEELREKTCAIAEAGFEPNPRAVLAADFFGDFMRRSGVEEPHGPEGAGEMRKRIMEGRFSEGERAAIREIAGKTNGAPVAVRSSAQGDSRGTGIYLSVFCADKDDLEHHVKQVLQSGYSESAIAMRKDLGLESGMAVMIEPVFGQRFGAHYGPLYGGLAYTSSSSGEGYMILGGGIPVGVVQGQGLRITEGHRGSVIDLVMGILDDLEFRLHERCGDINIQNSRHVHDWISQGAFIDMESGRLGRRDLPRTDFMAEGMGWIFRRLKKLEELLGRPQYVEWAATGDGRLGIVQISGLDPKTDFYELAESGRAVVRSSIVVGSGKVECGEALVIRDEKDIALLDQYNRTHKGYALIFGGSLISARYGAALGYGQVSNASVLVEIPELMHSQSCAAHFGGLADFTGKILMVAESINWDALAAHRAAGPLERYPVRLTASASERAQKGILEIQS